MRYSEDSETFNYRKSACLSSNLSMSMLEPAKQPRSTTNRSRGPPVEDIPQATTEESASVYIIDARSSVNFDKVSLSDSGSD